MLKTAEIYNVAVILNDGQTMVCTLLSKPNATSLAAIAEIQKVSAELIEAAAFAHDLAIPALGNEAIQTPITVAGTQIGAVQIDTQSAYAWPVRKPRKPKGETGEETNKPKRKGRKRKLEDTDSAANSAAASAAVDPEAVDPETVDPETGQSATPFNE